MDLVANKGLRRYKGRALKPGDTFKANRRDARVLTAIGRAGVPEVDGGTYQSAVPPTLTKRDPLDRDGNGAPGGSLPQSPPSLRGKSKAKLLEIAKAEKVTIADPEAANSVIIAAIEAARRG